MVDDLVRLILRPALFRDGKAGPPEFDATREDTDRYVCTSHQPAYDGARALLDGGELPTRLMTTRHHGRAHDNYAPAPIGAFARWTVSERGGRLQRERWRPGPGRKGEPL